MELESIFQLADRYGVPFVIMVFLLLILFYGGQILLKALSIIHQIVIGQQNTINDQQKVSTELKVGVQEVKDVLVSIEHLGLRTQNDIRQMAGIPIVVGKEAAPDITNEQLPIIESTDHSG